MRLFVVARLLAPSAAARTRAEVHQSSKRDAPPFHPLVVFKRGRTGSTWFADLLTNEPAVAFFAHEAQYCLKSCAAKYHGERRMLRRALGAILSTPTCEMDCNPHAHGAPTCDARRVAWAKGRLVDHYRGPPPCVRNRIVGFDANPTRAPFSHNDWIAVLRLPRVAPVVYVRTNAVKMAVSLAHSKVLVRYCQTHKVVNEKQMACFKAHKDKLRQKFRVDPTHLVEVAEGLGQMWVDTLRNVTAAAGRKPLVVYYEALQVNPKREIRRLFTFAGLPPTTKIKAESTSKKLTPEDLRATLLDFGKTAKFLRERRPGLHDQLTDTAHRVFKVLHLPGNRTESFEAYEH